MDNNYWYRLFQERLRCFWHHPPEHCQDDLCIDKYSGFKVEIEATAIFTFTVALLYLDTSAMLAPARGFLCYPPHDTIVP